MCVVNPSKRWYCVNQTLKPFLADFWRVLQVMTVKLLAHHASWLEDRPYLSPVAAAWIFALLAR